MTLNQVVKTKMSQISHNTDLSTDTVLIHKDPSSASCGFSLDGYRNKVSTGLFLNNCETLFNDSSEKGIKPLRPGEFNKYFSDGEIHDIVPVKQNSEVHFDSAPQKRSLPPTSENGSLDNGYPRKILNPAPKVKPFKSIHQNCLLKAVPPKPLNVKFQAKSSSIISKTAKFDVESPESPWDLEAPTKPLNIGSENHFNTQHETCNPYREGTFNFRYRDNRRPYERWPQLFEHLEGDILILLEQRRCVDEIGELYDSCESHVGDFGLELSDIDLDDMSHFVQETIRDLRGQPQIGQNDSIYLEQYYHKHPILGPCDTRDEAAGKLKKMRMKAREERYHHFRRWLNRPKEKHVRRMSLKNRRENIKTEVTSELSGKRKIHIFRVWLN